MSALTDLKMALAVIETTAKVLPHLPSYTIFGMVESVRKEFDINIPSWIKPSKEDDEPEQPLKTRIHLPLQMQLERHGNPMSVRTFIRRAIKAQYVIEKPWPAKTKPGKFRNRLVLSSKGYEYGTHVATSAQPQWYNDSFAQLLSELKR